MANTHGDAESRHVKDGGTVVEREAPEQRPPGKSACKERDKKRPHMTEPDPQTGNGFIDTATLGELQRLARSRPKSGRQAQAKASALRTLERLNRRGRVALPPCPEGWYPPNQAEFEELDRIHLEEHPEVRQRMWEIWHGY